MQTREVRPQLQVASVPVEGRAAPRGAGVDGRVSERALQRRERSEKLRKALGEALAEKQWEAGHREGVERQKALHVSRARKKEALEKLRREVAGLEEAAVERGRRADRLGSALSLGLKGQSAV